MEIYFTSSFWDAALGRIIRSAGQGFLLLSGLGAVAGEAAVLSWETFLAGLSGALGMAVLSLVTSLAFPPES